MLGSMFVGLLVGFLAGALTNRGERMGCFGKCFSVGLVPFWVTCSLELGGQFYQEQLLSQQF